MGIAFSKVPVKGLVTVITGCDTGFGYDAALISASRGAIVYATCLTDAGVKNLERLKTEQPSQYGSLRPARLDVTDWEAVQKFGKKVEEECPEGL